MYERCYQKKSIIGEIFIKIQKQSVRKITNLSFRLDFEITFELVLISFE